MKYLKLLLATIAFSTHTVKAIPITNNIITGTQTICNGTAPTLFAGSIPAGGNGTSYSYQWIPVTSFNPIIGVSPSGSSTNMNHQAGTMNIVVPLGGGYMPAEEGKIWYRRIVISGTDRDTSAAIEVTVNNKNTWLGTVDSSWSNPANWTYATGNPYYRWVPLTSLRNPVISGTAAINDLNIDSGRTVMLGSISDTLKVYGNINYGGNYPCYDGSKGTTIFSGSDAFQFAPNGIYYNLVFNALSPTIPIIYNATVKNKLISSSYIRLTGELIIDTSCTYSVSFFKLDNPLNMNGAKVTIRNIGVGGRTGDVVFPIKSFRSGNEVGTAIINNIGVADAFTVEYLDSVILNGLSGSKVATKAVNNTWVITEGTPGGSNVTLSLQWEAADELPGFSRAASYISYSSAPIWIDSAAKPATGTGPYTQKRAGLTVFNNTAFGVASGGMLPVELMDFVVIKQKDNISLNWKTASEADNDYFIIQRSVDGKEFEDIDRVKGKGTTHIVSSYQFDDTKAIDAANSQHTNKLYYRLAQVDFDQSITYSEVAAVNLDANGNELEISLSPNPFTDITYLNILSNQQAKSTLKITDIQGRLVAEKTLDLEAGMNTISIDELASSAYFGVYFVQIVTPQESVVKRIVKSK